MECRSAWYGSIQNASPSVVRQTLNTYGALSEDAAALDERSNSRPCRWLLRVWHSSAMSASGRLAPVDPHPPSTSDRIRQANDGYEPSTPATPAGSSCGRYAL